MAQVIAFQIELNGISTAVTNVEQLNNAVRQTRVAFNNATFGSAERQQLAQQLGGLTNLQAQLNQENRNATVAAGAAVGSYRAMNLELGQLRARYRDLSEADRSGQIGQNLQRQIQSLNGELVRIDAGIGNFQRNVGNYAESLRPQLDRLRQSFANLSLEERRGAQGQQLAAQFNQVNTELQRASQSLDQYAAQTLTVNQRIANMGRTLINTFGLIGAGLGLREGINLTATFSQKVSELQAITGVSGEALEGLKQQISDLSSITLEGGQVIVNTGADIAEALKLAGSARPELLSNTEALAAFTKEAIVFAKAGGLPIQDSINSLSSVISQFEKPATAAAETINILAAGAKEGASEIKDTAAAIEKFGAGAKAANISVAESVAIVETLGDKFIKGAEAGTQIRNILNRITAPEAIGKRGRAELEKFGVSLDVLKDKSLPLGSRLKELSKIQDDATAIVKVFGAENQTAAQILLGNLDRYEKLTVAVQGTNEAYKQAGINADNLAQLLSNLKNTAVNLIVALGTGLYEAAKVLADVLTGLYNIVNENKLAFLAAGVALATYQATLNSSRLLLLSFQAAQVGNTIVTNAATVAQKGLSLAMSAVPYVAVGIAIYGLVTAMQTWFGQTEAQIETQNVLLDSQKQLTEAYASEAQSAAELFAIAKSDVSSKEQKAKAVQKIISLYPDYLGGINTEAGVLNNLDAVQKSVNKGILEGAIARIKAQKIQEATSSLIDLELKKQQLLFEFQKQGIDSNSSFAATALNQVQGNIDEVKKRIADLPTFLAKVGEGLTNQNIDFTGLSVSDNQIKEVQKQLQELAVFRFQLQQRTGLDLDDEGKKRYDFLVSEERRLQAERQKLIGASLEGEKTAAQKSLQITQETEDKKDKAKGGKEGKPKEIETLDILQAKYKQLQEQLASLKDTPSKIPTSLFDDITKTKKEIDELTLKMIKAGLLPGIDKSKYFGGDSALKQAAGDLKDTYNEVFTDIATGQSELDKQIEEAHQAYLATLVNDEKEAQNKIFEDEKQKREKAIEDEKERRKNLQEQLVQGALTLATTISGAVFEIENEAAEKKNEALLDDLERRKQAELNLVQGNAAQEAAIERRFAAEKRALERKAFEDDKKRKINQALINGAIAVTNALATTVPFIPNALIAAGIAAASTVAQVAVISSKKFAKGGLITGKGTGTSDEIPIMASNGEFMVKQSSVERIGIGAMKFINETGKLPIATLPSTPQGIGGQNVTVSLTPESVAQIAKSVYEGALQGSEGGTSKGVVNAQKEIQRRNTLNRNLE